MAVYEPESPRNTCEYVPESPRKVDLTDENFVPIKEYEPYFHHLVKGDMKMAEHFRGDPLKYNTFIYECEERYKKFIHNTNLWLIREAEKPVPEPKEPINVPDRLDHVVVYMKVDASGHINVKLDAPMAFIKDKYTDKGKIAPPEVMLKALHRFGYPKWVLEKQLSKYEEMAEKKKNNEEFINRIFAKYNTKSDSSTKKTKHKLWRQREKELKDASAAARTLNA